MKHRRILAALLVLCLLVTTCVVPAAAADKLDICPDPGAISFSAGTVAPTATEDTVIAVGTVIVENTLNVRAGAGTGYEKVGTLIGGERVAIYETKTVGSTEWGRMYLGWISLDYVILDEDLVFTDAGYCGEGEDVLWGYAEDAKLLAIVGEGPMLDYPASASAEYMHPWLAYESEMRTVLVDYGVTYVGNYAFDDCTGLRFAYVADTVTEMGDGTFTNCVSLLDFYLPDTMTTVGGSTFRGCYNLLYAWLPTGLTALSSRMFEGCTALQQVVMPADVIEIGPDAFDGCTGITEISLPEGLTAIGESAFDSCTGLTHIDFPKSLTKLARGAFYNCHGLESMKFFGNAPTFGSDPFTGVEAVVYYPANNFTWTEEVRQDYGGTLTWQAVEIPGSDNPTITGTCGDNLTWTLAEGVLTISGTGDMDDYYDSTDYGVAPWFSYRNAITQVILPDGLTSIGEYAFYEASGLTAVTIPDSVAKIGKRAFYGCQGLETVVLPTGLTEIEERTFYNCYSLKEITIPAQVTSIGVAAFVDAGLEKITFLGDAPSFGADALLGVVATAYYPGGNATWTDDAMPDYNGNITWVAVQMGPDASGTCGEGLTWSLTGGVLTISGEGAMDDFQKSLDYNTAPWAGYADQITQVVLEPGVTTIGDRAFYFCENLTAVSIPDGVTNIGAYAFYADDLRAVEIPGSVTAIEERAFGCNWDLAQVVFHEGLVSIGESAFIHDQIITELEIPETVTTIEAEAFFDCAALTRITLPTGLTEIPSALLYDCSSLEEVTIPAGVTAIGESAFLGCESLTELILPDALTTIGRYAFKECTGLTAMTIPAGVTLIGSNSFTASGLQEITFLGDAPVFDDGYNSGFVGGVFYNLTVTAYYPYGNETWTEDVRQDYTGDITWIPYGNGTEVASGQSGETAWQFTDDGMLTISGTGAMKNYTAKTQMPWYTYLDQITCVMMEDGVTSIGDYAFYGMPNLEMIFIPETVTAIGNYAFKNSTALDGVVLPNGLTQLGESAFYGCTGLTAIDIPASLWTVKPYTFKNCTALAEVTFHEGNLMKIGDAAFYNTGLTGVVLPDCLDIVDVYAFKNCSNLAYAILSDSMTEIREATFYGTALPAIEIPEGITRIGPYAFKKCAELDTALLPTSLRTIGESAFMDCSGLSWMNIPEGVTAIGGYAFKRCSTLYDLTLPTTLTEIGDSALHSCTALTTLTIPENVAKIGEYCFSASALAEITFTGDAPTIGTGAFNKVTAAAYYPGANATWTADVMQPYGGTITWTAR